MKVRTGIRNFYAGVGLVFPALLMLKGDLLAAPQPNVLLIISDDQAYGDLSLNGNPILTTPHLDALGNESIRLEQFYVNSICAPTRASLLTGRYHLRTGVTDVTRRREVMKPSETTLGELFYQNGYRTGYFGKWHNGSVYPETPDGQGFSEFIGFPYGHNTLYFDPVLQHNGVNEQRKGYITDILTDDAISFIETSQQSGKPFFCYLAYNAPHTPVMAPQPLIGKYQQAGLIDRDAGIYAMVESLDTNIGRLMSRLSELNLRDNTLVIFMSDNGPAYDRYNAGMKGRKASHHEGGVRVPCFWRWPGKWNAPAVVNRRLMHIDVLPTLTDLCGLDGTAGLDLDGQSFAPLLDNPQASWPDRTFCLFPSGDASRMGQVGSVRTDRWLAVKSWRPWELYDLLADPAETNDLAGAEPAILQTLQAEFNSELTAFNIDVDYQTPVPVGDPVRPAVLLEAPDANLNTVNGSGIQYSDPSGYAHTWITAWTNTDAYPEWPVNVMTRGFYRVTFHCALATENIGVHFQVCSGTNKVYATLNDAYVVPVVPQPFLIPEEAVKYETRIWTNRTIGTIYLDPGEQSIRLKVETIPGSEALELKDIELEMTEQLPDAPVASFNASPTSGAAPLAVTFTDTSVGTITGRHWDFGDGSTTNTLGTVITHTYTAMGSNTVVLIVSGPGGSSINAQPACIKVLAPVPPSAVFGALPRSGTAPLTVTFTDTSTGTITNRFWDFGDGSATNTTTAGITHRYTSAGTNTVRLIVSGPAGASTNTQVSAVIAASAPPPNLVWTANAADVGTEDNGVTLRPTTSASIRIGQGATAGSSVYNMAVLPFLLPDLPAGQAVSAAGLSIQIISESYANLSSGQYLDIIGVRSATSPTVLLADFSSGTVVGANVLYMDDVAVVTNILGVKTFTADGLGTYLQSIYDSPGYVSGSTYVFLRLAPNAPDTRANSYITINSANAASGTVPTLALTTGSSSSGLADADSDGLPDEWEIQYFGSSANADPDALAANGVNTLREAHIAGIDPTNPASVFRISGVGSLTAGSILQWSATSGRIYSIHGSTNLLVGFRPLETNILWPQNSWTDSADRTGAFYKLQVELSP